MSPKALDPATSSTSQASTAISPAGSVVNGSPSPNYNEKLLDETTRAMSLWSWLNRPSNHFPGCWVDDIPSHHLRIDIGETDQGYEGAAYPTGVPEVPFLRAKGTTPEEAAQKLEEQLLRHFPDLQGIFSPEQPKTALERILSEEGP